MFSENKDYDCLSENKDYYCIKIAPAWKKLSATSAMLFLLRQISSNFRSR